MAERYVVVAGREVPIRPGDSMQRMERVARYVENTLAETQVRAEAHGREPDEAGRMLETILRLGDEVMLAQDENMRLRRELTGMRAHVFDLERANDELKREMSVMRMRLEELENAACESATQAE